MDGFECIVESPGTESEMEDTNTLHGANSASSDCGRF